VEDVGEVIRCFPALGEMRLYREGAWRNLRTDLIPQQRTVDKAQGGIGPGIGCKVVIKVHGIIATHMQDAAALGLTRFRTPEGRGTREGQDGHREAGYKAHVQQLTTAETFSKVRIGTLCMHRDPSL
jgi:hypothetical protein